ncbi:MAG: hypothetical protein FWE16_01030 [Firmicutes bacterium]|nr:hypothetical protein [Bacillota bacterium]
MANRRLIAVLIVFIVLAGVMVAGGTIFRVRNIELSFANQLDYIENEQETLSNLRSSINSVHGNNILFNVDRNFITETLEYADFRVRVTNIEVRFPNILRITVRERYPVFELDLGNRQMIFDSQFRYVTSERRGTAPLIEIPVGMAPTDIDELERGGFIFDLEMEQSTRLKFERKRDIADLFWARNNFEDSINNLFETIAFEAVGTYTSGPNVGMPRYVMILDRRDSPTIIEIIGIRDQDLFRQKLTKVWFVMEYQMHHFPGLYRVYYNNGNIQVLSPPPFGGQ